MPKKKKTAKIMTKSKEKNVRIDKYLWAVRIYKTRSIASDACKKGKVLINGIPVKPSRTINKSDEFQVKQNPVLRTYRIIGILSKRTGAKHVSDYLEEITPEEELLKLDMHEKYNSVQRDKGKPTKKERRDLKYFFE